MSARPPRDSAPGSDGDAGAAGTGDRFLFTLDARASTSERAVYRGTVTRGGDSHGVEIVVTRERCEGQARDPDSPLAAELAARAATLVRAVARGPLTEGRLPPRRIHRWRP